MRHDGGTAAYVPARTVATWPKGSFAENLAVDRDGFIFVTLHTDRAIVRVDPDSGRVETFATMAAPVAGIVVDRGGDLYVSGGMPGEPPGLVWRVASDATVRLLATIPDAAFLNGMTWHPDGRLLVAESIGGRVYACDPSSGRVTVWLADDALTPGDPASPGANGIKVFGRHAIISVTAKDRVMRTRLGPDGAPGPLESLAEHLRADDFAVGADDSLLIATHPAHSVVRLAPDGTRTTLASAAQGTKGATAVAFGRRAGDRRSLYVTTTGGTMTLPPDQCETAKLVRLDVDTDAAPDL